MNDLNIGKQYILNIPLIDSQHTEFLRLVDKAYELMKNEKDYSNQISMELLLQLENYMKYHFSEEEAMMLKANYSGLEAHKQQHSYFIQKIEDYKHESNFNSAFLPSKLLEFMKKWFLFHIMHTDSQYSEDVKKII